MANGKQEVKIPGKQSAGKQRLGAARADHQVLKDLGEECDNVLLLFFQTSTGSAQADKSHCSHVVRAMA